MSIGIALFKSGVLQRKLADFSDCPSRGYAEVVADTYRGCYNEDFRAVEWSPEGNQIWVSEIGLVTKSP